MVHQLVWGPNFKAPQNEPPNNIGGCTFLDDRSVRVTKRMTKVAPCELAASAVFAISEDSNEVYTSNFVCGAEKNNLKPSLEMVTNLIRSE